MKTKILMLGLMLMLFAYPVAATTYNGNVTNPVTVSVRYNVASNTDFSVDVCGTQTAMNFSGTRDAKEIEATCQVRSSNTEWANLTNGGNVQQTFYLNTYSDAIGTEGGQVWIKPDNSTPSVAPRLILGTSGAALVAHTNVPAGQSRKVFAYANYSSTMTNPLYTDSLTISTATPI